MNKLPRKYIFIDESGDPTFYGSGKRLLVGTEGFQPYLIIGMIETMDRKALRRAVLNFMEVIKNDVLFNSIPSVSTNKGWYVHARGDHPEVRLKFFEFLRNLEGFKVHIAVARKDLSIFNRKHNNNPSEFYFDVLHHLLANKMTDDNIHYKLFLSQRGNNSMNRFSEAVLKALKNNKNTDNNNGEINYSLEIVPSNDMPELSIIDYMIWAVQRKLLKGESRFFEALKSKYEAVVELYSEA
ncbi:MAG: DUF3800 domain-containing protein [Emticicia sp.]|nr:DUF3800 domain-containing protein [Emticicia sp.]